MKTTRENLKRLSIANGIYTLTFNSPVDGAGFVEFEALNQSALMDFLFESGVSNEEIEILMDNLSYSSDGIVEFGL